MTNPVTKLNNFNRYNLQLYFNWLTYPNNHNIFNDLIMCISKFVYSYHFQWIITLPYLTLYWIVLYFFFEKLLFSWLLLCALFPIELYFNFWRITFFGIPFLSFQVVLYRLSDYKNDKFLKSILYPTILLTSESNCNT